MKIYEFNTDTSKLSSVNQCISKLVEVCPTRCSKDSSQAFSGH